MKMGLKRRFCVVLLTVLCFFAAAGQVHASTISEIKKDIQKNQNQLKDAQQKISDAQEAKEGAKAQIEEMDAELVSLIADISLIEESIAQKEEEIAATQLDYEAAVADKEAQYAAMKVRIRFMYERGDSSYLSLFFGAKSMGDIVNKTEYVAEIYDYDRKLLERYQETVKRVQELQDRLEEDKSELVTSRTELKEGQAYLEELLAEKQAEYENYSVMLAKAKQSAATYAARIKKETAQLRKLEEEERKRKEEEEKKRKEEEKRRQEQEAQMAQAGDGDSSGGSAGSGSSGAQSSAPAPVPSGGGKGQDIASYACKFVGNPYRAGGTSLTQGADCSGFVLAVYQKFGISLPRSSYSQSTVGRAVSYSEARPGDIIYYGGHVGIYIGNGQIVHASTERTGIKISSALYRNIITVRRIV